jgi:hypothetical protein
MRTAILTAALSSLLGCVPSDSLPDVADQPEQTSHAGLNMSHPELEFFNSLSGKLEIELTEPPEKIGDLDNVRAKPEAKIKSLRLSAELFNRETETARELTPEEFQSVAFRASQITLRGEGGGVVKHLAPNGSVFTVQDLLKAVEETERQSRGASDWFDGVDVHHVYFEGIHLSEDGVWEIYWGS